MSELKYGRYGEGAEVYTPSPEEIQEKCREIQCTWSPGIQRLRLGAHNAEPADTKVIQDPMRFTKLECGVMRKDDDE